MGIGQLEFGDWNKCKSGWLLFDLCHGKMRSKRVRLATFFSFIAQRSGSDEFRNPLLRPTRLFKRVGLL